MGEQRLSTHTVSGSVYFKMPFYALPCFVLGFFSYVPDIYHSFNCIVAVFFIFLLFIYEDLDTAGAFKMEISYFFLYNRTGSILACCFN